MPMPRPMPSPGLDVLALDLDQAEWLSHPEGRGPVVGSAPVDGRGPADLARASLAARDAAGSRARRAILSLGPGLVSVRLIQTPVLSRRNLAVVMRRKAAAIAGCEPEEVLYAATRCGEDSDGSGEGKREIRWAVAALRRSRLREILLSLRRSGVSVRRVVASPLAVPTRAAELAGPGDDATIAIGVDRRCVHVALLGGGGLAMQNALEGSFEAQPSMALGLLQEVRSVDAFWRKHSRGGSVGRIVLLGLEGERAGLLVNALGAAIPGARVVRDEVRVQADPATAGRVGILSCARAGDGVQVDLSVPVPAEPVTIAAMAAAFLLCVGVAGTVGYEHTHGREMAMREELEVLSRAAAGLDGLEVREAEARAKLAELGALTERNAAVLRDGWPLQELLGDCLEGLGSDAALLSLRGGVWERERELSLEAITSSHPFASMQHIARVRTRLEESPLLEIVKEEARGLPGDRSGGFVFAFEARAAGEP